MHAYIVGGGVSKIRKQEQYDTFTCIADQCKFTCCSGWEVAVDKDTATLWKNSDNNVWDVDKHLKFRKKGKKTEYVIKAGPGKRCPFLNATGLCDIVISRGDSALPRTCRTFPRIINSMEDTEEYSLSLACPVVVDMVYQRERKMDYRTERLETQKERPEAKTELAARKGPQNSEELRIVKLRTAMIGLLQIREYPLQDRILLAFHMLISYKEELENLEHASEEDEILNEVTDKYRIPEFQKAFIKAWSGLEYDIMDACSEVNELFLDITQNYRREKLYKTHLQDICYLAEEMNIEECITEWKLFQPLFGQLDSFLENCLVSKVFSSCVSEELDALILSYQMLITEYVMVRYSTFLCWRKDKKAVIIEDRNIVRRDHNFSDISDYYPRIRDYIVSYSRIIGYNTEGMKEFWEESFDEAIWELGYVFLLVK